MLRLAGRYCSSKHNSQPTTNSLYYYKHKRIACYHLGRKLTWCKHGQLSDIMVSLAKIWYTFDTIKSVSNLYQMCIKCVSNVQYCIKWPWKCINSLSKVYQMVSNYLKTVPKVYQIGTFWYRFDTCKLYQIKFDTLLIQQHRGSMTCIWYIFDTLWIHIWYTLDTNLIHIWYTFDTSLTIVIHTSDLNHQPGMDREQLSVKNRSDLVYGDQP